MPTHLRCFSFGLRHYNTKLSSGDAPVADRVKGLEKDPELAAVFEDIKKNGMDAAMKYYQASFSTSPCYRMRRVIYDHIYIKEGEMIRGRIRVRPIARINVLQE